MNADQKPNASDPTIAGGEELSEDQLAKVAGGFSITDVIRSVINTTTTTTTPEGTASHTLSPEQKTRT